MLLLSLLFLPIAAQDRAAVEAYCSSFRIKSGVFETGDQIWFTGITYTNDISQSGSLVSGEFKPERSSIGTAFSSKCIFNNPTNYFGLLPVNDPSEHPVTTNGTIRLEFPTQDTNQNLVQDWLEFDRPSSVPVTGRFQPVYAKPNLHWKSTTITGRFNKRAAATIGTYNLELVTSWAKQVNSATVTLFTNWISGQFEVQYLAGFLNYDKLLANRDVKMDLEPPEMSGPGVHVNGYVINRERGYLQIQITNTIGRWRLPQSQLRFNGRRNGVTIRDYFGLAEGFVDSGGNSDGDIATKGQDFLDWTLLINQDPDADGNGFSDLTDGPHYPNSVLVHNVMLSSSLDITLAKMSIGLQTVWLDESDDLLHWRPVQNVLVGDSRLIDFDPEFVRKFLLPVKKKVSFPINSKARFYRVY